MASAKPTISSTVSPFMCRATSRAAICASVALPERTSVMTRRASSRASDSRWFAMRWRASVIMDGYKVSIAAGFGEARRQQLLDQVSANSEYDYLVVPLVAVLMVDSNVAKSDLPHQMGRLIRREKSEIVFGHLIFLHLLSGAERDSSAARVP